MDREKFFFLTGSLLLALAGVMMVFWLAGGTSPACASLANRYVAVTGEDTANDCTTPSQPCRTIQHAVDAADAGDTILIASGVYTGVQDRPVPPGYRFPPVSGVIAQVVYITKTITLRGGYTTDFSEPPNPEANPTTLDAQGEGRVIVVTGNISTTLQGLSITGGEADGLGGSGMWDDTDAGGGVYIITATATVNNNHIYKNNARDGGGIYLYTSPSTLSDNEVYSNTTQYTGGGVLVFISNATLDNNSIHHNSAYYLYGLGSGGGVYVHKGTPTISGNTVYSNTAYSSGGGIMVQNSLYAMLINNTVISNTTHNATNSARGGGIYLRDSLTNTMIGNTIIANKADSRGGGVFLWSGYATLSGNTCISNTADAGGGMYFDGMAVSVTASTVLSNTADFGGGIYMEYAHGSFTQNIISGNRATALHAEGGGIYMADSYPVLDGNIIRFNEADRGGGVGLYRSEPVILNTVLADNTAEEYGGGINIRQRSHPALIHTTIARNHGGNDSGISLPYGSNFSTVAMTNTILVSHTVGITVAEGSTATLAGTLWYANTTGWDGLGGIITGTHNLWTNPLLAADGYHIAAGSPAIDQGLPTAVTSDIDGDPRDLLPDLGADEIFTCSPLTGVTITGPTEGYTGAYYGFIAVITPTIATPPIVYVWSPEPASGQDSAAATYTWAVEGDQTIHLTASNCDGSGTASDDHTITLFGGIEWKFVYLPVMWKVWP